MSLSAASPGEMPVGDQKRLPSSAHVPAARRLTPKADATLIPEPR